MTASTLRRALALALAPAAFAAPALAQDVIFEHHALAGSIATVGDVDGDGVVDYALGMPFEPWGPLSGFNRGKVRVHSGATHLPLFEFKGDLQTLGFGQSIVALGDVDQDGVNDLAAHGDGYVRVFSLGARQVLYTLTGNAQSDRYAFAVAAMGDVDGDGRADLAVGAPQTRVMGSTYSSSGPGFVEIRSGLTGALLRTLTGPGNFSAFGGSLAGCGDRDGDGVGDLAVSQYLGPSILQPNAQLRGYSGASGAQIFQAPISHHGSPVASAGDVDADGIEDFVLREPSSATGVLMMSGASGATLFTAAGASLDDDFGRSVCRIGDLDADGAPDLLVGAPQIDPWCSNSSQPGYARVLSGRSGTVLRTFVGDSWYQALGIAVSGLQDLDGDGLEELLIAGFDGSGGLVRLYSGHDGFSAPTNHCTGAYNFPAGEMTIGWLGSTSVSANQWTLTLASADPGAVGQLFCGRRPIAKPFDPMCTSSMLCVLPPVTRVGAPRIVSPQGTLQQQVGLGPTSPFTIGSTWCFQFATASPQPARETSDALAVTFTP